MTIRASLTASNMNTVGILAGVVVFLSLFVIYVQSSTIVVTLLVIALDVLIASSIYLSLACVMSGPLDPRVQRWANILLPVIFATAIAGAALIKVFWLMPLPG